MPHVKATEFIRSLKQGKTNLDVPYIFVSGEEAYLLQEVQTQLTQVLLPKANDFNHARFFASEAESQDIIDALFVLPFGSPRRLVIVKNCEDLAYDDFLPYLASPCQTTLLLMVSSAGVDMRRKFFKAFVEKGLLIDAGPLEAPEAAVWIKYFAGRNQLAWKDSQVPILIQQMVGNHLSQLEQAVERLFLFHGEKSDLTPADVLAVLADTREGFVFSLTEAMGRGDRAGAYLQVKRLLRDSDLGVFITTLGALNQFYRRLLWIRTAMQKKTSDAELQKVAGISPGALFFNKKIASKMSLQKLRQNLITLHEADISLKTSRVPKEILLFRTIDRLLLL